MSRRRLGLLTPVVPFGPVPSQSPAPPESALEVELVDLGPPELIIILVIVLLLFGGRKLPDLARSLGEAKREFNKSTTDDPDEKAKAKAPPAPDAKAAELAAPADATATIDPEPTEAPTDFT